MQKLPIILFFFLCSSITFAQNKLPSFGKIDKADLEMKDCDFDPGAEAVVLIDYGFIKFGFVDPVGWQQESEYRVRIKILKEKALGRSEIKLSYYAKDRIEEITGVTGVSYSLDEAGNIITTKLEKKSVFDKVINSQYSEISFALPALKVGSVFEYRYKKISKAAGNIPDWTFQQRIPVKYSEYKILVPQYFSFTMQSVLRQKMEKIEGKSVDEGNSYIMQNIPGLKDEPYSAGIINYYQKIEFQLSKIESPGYYKEYRNTWPKLITELLEDDDFGRAINKNLRGTDDIVKSAAAAGSEKEKIRTIYNYVQSNMQWNDNYSKYSRNGIKDAWDKKNANITDINFILINLLREAKIDAKPLLVSTVDNGSINMIFPFLGQFNAVLAYVKTSDHVYIMNAADKFNPFYLVPYDVLNTNALLVDKNEGGLVGITGLDKYKNNIFFTGSIDNNAMINGSATIQSADYARNIRMNTVKKQKLKEVFEDNTGIALKIDSISFNNEKNELLPLEQKFNFSGPLQSTGEYYFLPFTLFTGMEKNPFIEETRVMNIDFNFPRSTTITGTFILPDDFTVDALPKNTRMIMPDTSIALTRIVQADGRMISFRFSLEIDTDGYDAESYPYIKEFYKKMYEILDERIVLKKK